MINFNIFNRMNWNEFYEKYEISHRMRKKLFKSGGLLLNGRISDKNAILIPGDIVSINIPDEEITDIPENIPLDIIYEDDYILAVNKPPFMLSHPTKNHLSGTLLNAVAYYFEEISLKRKVRLISRLDRDTSGMILIAKNSYVHSIISQSEFEKEYIAFVEGRVEKDEGEIKKNIKKEGIKNIVDDEGEFAHTEYGVIERYKDATFLSLKIHTGKNHQIRTHMAHIGHSVIGDTLYGNPSEFINRQALHSYKVKIRIFGEDIEIIAPMPKDMEDLRRNLKIEY